MKNKKKQFKNVAVEYGDHAYLKVIAEEQDRSISQQISHWVKEYRRSEEGKRKA